MGHVSFYSPIASVLIILYRHSQYGFTFSTINKAVIPIYRNHVDYACSLGILLPFAWWMDFIVEPNWFGSALTLASTMQKVAGYPTNRHNQHDCGKWE